MRSTVPGRKFCTNRSACATIRFNSSMPRASFRLIATDRLLRLAIAKVGDIPRRRPARARVRSPIPGGSTLITSAPWSPRIIVAIGPEIICVTSIMRKPLSGPGMMRTPPRGPVLQTDTNANANKSTIRFPAVTCEYVDSDSVHDKFANDREGALRNHRKIDHDSH